MADLRLVAFVLVLVGGILAVVEALRSLRFDFLARSLDVDFLLLLLGGLLGLVSAARGHKGTARDAGILGLIGGILVLLAGNDLPGVLLLVGGILYLVGT